MFTQPVNPSSGLLTPTTVTTTPSSSPNPTSRGGRLRGLSYLRNYTQNHRLSRDIVDSTQGRDTQTSGPRPGPGSIISAALDSHSQGSGRSPSLTLAATTHFSTGAGTGRRRPVPAAASVSDTTINTSTTSGASSASTAAANNPPSSASSARTARLRISLNRPLPQPVNDLHLSPLADISDSEYGGASQNLITSGTTATSNQVAASTTAAMTRTRSATTGDLSADMLPSIRFSAHYDPRSNRQSLSFTPVSRTLPTGKEVIKVGRYSEREQQVPVPVNTPSAAPVGFKSKVVSRRHCEFWHENGKWYIKDVKSSSGTFLNHIRLSPPGNESKPYIVNDGDIVQLGIDFRGGEEMIFRCVKMRIELNRGWQAKPNNFNVATHKRLRNMTSSASTASHAQDCSICLNAIAPCQSLFVAPCSHTWHYKCIRELLSGPSYPIFMCPNCRAAADLDAEIDEPEEDWQQLDSGMDDVSEEHPEEPNPPPAQEPAEPSVALMDAAEVVPTPAAPSAPSPVEAESGDVTMMLDGGPAEEEPTSTHAVSNPVPIATPRVNPAAPLAVRNLRTPSPNGHPNAAPNGHEGPLTPRNDAGPWVFDGDAGRSSQEVSRQAAMSSLDAAAAPV